MAARTQFDSGLGVRLHSLLNEFARFCAGSDRLLVGSSLFSGRLPDLLRVFHGNRNALSLRLPAGGFRWGIDSNACPAFSPSGLALRKSLLRPFSRHSSHARSRGRGGGCIDLPSGTGAAAPAASACRPFVPRNPSRRFPSSSNQSAPCSTPCREAVAQRTKPAAGCLPGRAKRDNCTPG